MLYWRLYELRNQVVHGAAKAGSRMNRDSLKAAVPILSVTVPVLRKILWEHRDDDWGEPAYRPLRRVGGPDPDGPPFNAAKVSQRRE